MRKKVERIRNKRNGPDVGIRFEALEPRLLLSGSWGAGADGPSPDTQASTPGDFSTTTVTLAEGPDTFYSDALFQNQHTLGTGTYVDVLAEAPVLDAFQADNADNVDPEGQSTSNQTPPLTDDPLPNGAESNDNPQQDLMDAAMKRELIFINDNITDYEQLIADLQGGDNNRVIETVILDADRDGIEQVSEILANRSDLAAVHFITHGSDGQINLGNNWLNSTSLQQNSDAVAGWGNALTENGDMLFYGCNIAADTDGQSLLDNIAELTGAEVAASDDLTGNSGQGGDWDLEYTRGKVETNFAISSSTQSTWSGVLDTFAVTSTNATGTGSLHQAILDANANVGVTDTITFSIGTGPQTIAVGSAGLPIITDSVILDATTQPGYSGTPLITLDGSATPASSGINGITLRTSDSTVKGFIVINFADEGIEMDGSTGYGDNNIIQNNWIGIDAVGNVAANAEHGIMISADANGNRIGGTGPNEGNVTAGNGYSGIIINENSDNNIVEGNFIGLKPDGTTPAGNGTHGILIQLSSDGNRIGGTTAGAGNVISGNTQDGIYIDGTTDATYTTISTGTVIQGNWVGTTGTGSTGVGNGNTGINVEGTNTIIGGTGANDGNVITNNGNEGINVTGSGATGTIVRGNIIGLDPDGSTGSGNADVGIALLSGSHNTTIGGPTAAARNVISKNIEGIEINSNNNVIQGNYIGTDAGGTLDRGNHSDDGVEIKNGATGNLIGGEAVGAGNIIAFNALNGVNVVNGSNNAIVRNSIHSNTLLGINLGTAGVTANDGGDGDGGANNLQNFPVLTSAETTGSQITITGTINSTPSTSFRIEFYSNSIGDGTGYGEGQTLIGVHDVTTDGSGNAVISAVLPAAVSAGSVISATVSRLDLGDAPIETSEFAQNVIAVAAGNAVPVLTTSGGATSYTEQNAAVTVDAGITLVDPDGFNGTDPSDQYTAVIRITGNYEAADTLGFTNTTKIQSVLAGDTLTLSVIGGQTASEAEFQTALRSVTFYNGSDTPGTLDRTISFTFDDGVDSSNTATKVLEVTAVNDDPVLTLPGPVIVYIENDPPTVIDGAATLTDVDSVEFDTGDLRVGFNGGTGTGNDILAIRNQGSGTGQIGVSGSNVTYGGVVIGTFSGGIGGTLLDIDFNVNATTAAVQALVRNITYENTSDNPSTTSRTVRFQLRDGDGGANSFLTKTVNVAAQNDAPVGVVASNFSVINEDDFTSPGKLVSAFTTTTSDPDAGALKGIAVIAADNSNGSWQYTLDGTNWVAIGNVAASSARLLPSDGIARVRFVPNPDYNGAASPFTVVAWDQTTGVAGGLADASVRGGTTAFSTSSATVGQAINAINDAPVNTAPGTQTVFEETSTAINGISISDVDANGANLTTRILVSNGVLNITLVGSATISAGTNGTNDFTILGTVADINTTLLTLTYTGNTNVTGTGADTLTVRTGDGGNSGSGGVLQDTDIIQIDITPVNDAPVLLTGSVNNLTVNEDSGLTSLGLGSVNYGPGGGSDESGQTLTYQVTVIPAATSGDIFLADGTTRVTTGSYTLAEIKGMQFKPAENASGTTAFQFNVYDSGGTANGGVDNISQFMLITVNPINDLPVARPDGVHLSFDGGDYIQIANDPSLLMTNNMTMEAWINHSGGGTGSQLILNKEGEYELGITADTGEIKFSIAETTDTWTWHNTGYFVTPGEWTHVAVTYDGVAGEVKTYINGQLVDTYAQSGAIGDVYGTYNDMYIGGRGNATDQRFQGLIDEVRVWNSTLTQGEIQANMNGLLTGVEPGLVGNWRLDEGSDTNAVDQSTSGNNGILGGIDGLPSIPAYQGYITNEDTVLTIPAASGVLANDTDFDGDPLTVTNVDDSGLLGTLVLNTADGSFSYDPRGAFDNLGAGEHATETFTYTAYDGTGYSNTVTVTITVIGTNDVPVATANTVTTAEDTAYSFNATDFTFTDTEGDALVSATITNLNLNGGTLTHSGGTAVTSGDTLTAVELDTLVYTPAADATGSPLATFDFTVNDAGVGVVAAQMSINVTAVNDVPEATANTVTTTEDTAYSFNSTDFTFTDTEVNALVSATITNLNLNGGTLTHSGGTAVTSGDTLTAAELDTLVYTPAADATGSPLATFDFTVNDAGVGVVAAQMSINVTAVNDVPEATANTVTTTEDTAYSFNSTDFTFTDTEGNALVSATIINLNLNGGTLTHSGGTAVASGDTLTAAELDTLVYTPAADATGSPLATFDFTVNDAGVGVVAAQMSINVTAVNDVPEATANTVTTTEDTAYSFNSTDFTFTDTEVNALVSATITNLNLNGGTLTHSGGTAVTSGDTLTAAELDTLVYTPAADATGSPLATFDFTVNDAGVGVVAAQMSINVTAVNDVPEATANTVTTTEDTAYSFNSTDFTFTDTEGNALVSATITNLNLNGGTLTHSGGTAVASGDTLTAAELDTLVYTPAADATGSPLATFDFTVNDAGVGVVAAQMSVNVTAVNDDPVITNNTGLTIVEEGTAIITQAMLEVTDADNSAAEITYTIATDSVHGILRNNGVALGVGSTFTQADINNGLLTYQDTDLETTSDSFSFTVSDGAGGSIGATTFNITVTPVNDSPSVATNTGTTVDEGSTGNVITMAMLNEGDPDDSGTGLIYTLTSNVGNGTLRLNGTALNTNDTFTQADIDSGLLTYDHDDSNTTSDSFDFTLADGGENGSTPAAGTFNITVTAVDDDPPVQLINTGSTVTEGGTDTISSTELRYSDSEQPVASLTYTVTSDPGNGRLELSTNPGNAITSFTQTQINAGRVVYIHDGSDTTSDSFTFSVDDGQGNAVTGQIFSLTITAVNDAPTIEAAIADQNLAEDFASYTIDLNAAFADVETTDANLIYGVSGNTNINVSIAAGIATITPTADWNGSETLTFTATDEGGLSVSQDVVFAVSAVADIADDSAVSVTEDTPTVIAVLANDTFEGTPVVTGTSTPSNGAVVINGDNTITYTPNANYTGADSFTYTVTSGGVTETATVTINVTPDNDTPTGFVTIDNMTPVEGDTLAVSNSLADADGLSGPISYQWFLDGVAIGGETGTTYTTVQADVGGVITVVASYTDDQGTFESVPSAATAAVANVNNAPTGTVTISGTPVEDQTLTASNTLADTDGMGTVSYQWQSDGVIIAGATGSSYTLGDADVGTFITVIASYTDGQGTSESVTSAQVGPVANINDAPVIGGSNTGAVTKDVDPDSDGQIEVGGALSISDPDAGESSFQPRTVLGTYGSLTIDAAGSWSYAADNTQAAIQQLGAGERLTDVLSVTTSDGTTHNVTITINGATGSTVVDSPPPIDNGGPDPGPEDDTDPIEPDPEEIPPTDDEVPPPEEIDPQILHQTSGPEAAQSNTAQLRRFGSTMGSRIIGNSYLNATVSPSITARYISALKIEITKGSMESRIAENFISGATVFFSPEIMAQALDHLQRQIDDTLELEENQGQVIIGAAAGFGASVMVGYVLWAFRGTSLLLGALSAMPMWRSFDPLPVLLGRDKELDEEKDEKGVRDLLD